MPVTIEFEYDGLGAVIVASGDLRGDEFYQANKVLYEPDILAKLRYQIVDLSAVESVVSDWDKIKRLADSDKEAAAKTDGQKLAIIANKSVLKGLAQIYQRHATDDKLETRVFSNMRSARRWIESQT